MPAVAAAEEYRAAAVRLIKDSDPTVRQAAVNVFNQAIVPEVLPAIASQLGDEYKPLYDAATRVLITQKDAAVRDKAIALAAALLEHENPRRRQDGSYILGVYRSDAALEQHIAIVESSTAEKPDWKLVAQAVDSLGRIGRPEAKPAIARLAHETKKAFKATDADYRMAVSTCLVSGGRLGDASVLPDCIAGASGSVLTTPGELRAAGLFGVGMLGKPSDGHMFGSVIRGEFDPPDAKMEAIKAIGNMRSHQHLGSLTLQAMLSTQMRWMAHWATGRITGETTPFVPETLPWRADVSITDATPTP
jgi:HEAT repeat protein